MTPNKRTSGNKSSSHKAAAKDISAAQADPQTAKPGEQDNSKAGSAQSGKPAGLQSGRPGTPQSGKQSSQSGRGGNDKPVKDPSRGGNR